MGDVVEINKRKGRNKPCVCGSGKKYKNCCMQKNNDEQALQKRLAEHHENTLSYCSIGEYMEQVKYPLRKIDIFIIEMLNVAGDGIDRFRVTNTNEIKRIIRVMLVKSKIHLLECDKCKLHCLTYPDAKFDKRLLAKSGIKPETFPEIMQKPVRANLFYFHFMLIFFHSLIDELGKYVDNETACRISSYVITALSNYITFCCWEECESRCIVKSKQNAYCDFCGMSDYSLPCPMKDEISYSKIKAKPKDMKHK